ncbi:MAG: LysR family transcriptional regulator [Mesorhizobium sp.]|uniref:LysR family transcriptional regulator n=1 Tax=Mesorhizobium sp. TaxID=1871066 RepID=UPI000FE8CDDB|nr:LysR family transcriptional regulator [Mesorhizobium sp.]RWM98741.1 MAG: LysR family transcriptional regulator [Mesorhizobium sp.]
MITLKQAEAFYWIAMLGSVVEAADRLHLAQSTLSKRVVELETFLGAALFDRSNRTVSLTRVGENLVPIAADLLKLEVRFRETATGPRAFSGPFRFGVTELVALTWLPKLIVAMKEAYPKLVPEPEVDASVSLFTKLAERRLDLVIGLDPPSTEAFKMVPLDSVRLQWMCAPGAGPPEANVVPLSELARYPVLTQGEGSGLQKLVIDRLHASGITFDRIVKCNSLSVLAALAAAGLGITFLNEHFSQAELRSGRLRIIRTTPEIPPIQYFAVYRTDALDPLADRISQIAKRCCDFSNGSNPS